MGKSFNDRNRKKGAERAYRKTKPKFNRKEWVRESGSDGGKRTEPGSQPVKEEWQPDKADWF